MLPFRLVYHPGYDLNFGDHVFPTQKYRLIRQRLLEERAAEAEDFVLPEPATEEDLLRVHDAGWIQRLKTGTLTYREILTLEIPYSRQMVQAFWLAAGGTILSGKLALEQGIGFNLGGGFHHAFAGHGEGFCAIHDVAVAIRRLQAEGLISTAMVVDCDVHHGNGTASIFAADPSVFTLSIHQFNNYPSEKPHSSLDIHLPDGADDRLYVERLQAGYVPVMERFQPDLLFYVAGADPFYQDQLGGLSLTKEGLQERDRLVMETALECGTPVAVVLAGGYAAEVADTVSIHCGTVLMAREALRHVRWRRRRNAGNHPAL